MSQDLDSLYEETDEQLRTGTLSFSKEPTETSRTSQHIQTWRNAPILQEQGTNIEFLHRGVSENEMEEPIVASLGQEAVIPVWNNMHIPIASSGLRLQVVSAQPITIETEKKYVAYTIRVRKYGVNNDPNSRAPTYSTDPNPAYIQRRYTDFLDLYNNLRREHPALMVGVTFPRKVWVGNFEQNVISDRGEAFNGFLLHLSQNDKLYQAPCFAAFLQGAEQKEARTWILQKRYDQAIPLLENSFRLLNKIYTDRHSAVMVALCRLVACCAADSSGEAKAGGRAERFAEIALRRFEGVSDADLLAFYVPLLQLCVHLWWTLGKDKQALSDELESLKRRGIKVDGCGTLLDAMLDLKI